MCLGVGAGLQVRTVPGFGEAQGKGIAEVILRRVIIRLVLSGELVAEHKARPYLNTSTTLAVNPAIDPTPLGLWAEEHRYLALCCIW